MVSSLESPVDFAAWDSPSCSSYIHSSIVGNGTGSIGVVDISFPPGSTIACRSAYPACGSNLGTTILGLEPGCPTIGRVRIVLNGTNTSTSMVSNYPTASFALINMDNSTGTLAACTPRQHDIIIDNISALFVETPLLLLHQAVGFLLVSIPYPLYNGTMRIRGVSILSVHAQYIALLVFDNPIALMLTFESVESEVQLVQVSQGWYSKSSVCGGAARIHFRNCMITTFFASAVDVPRVGGDSTDVCILELEVEMRNTSLSPHNQHAIVNVNPPSELLSISVTLTVLSCTAVLEDTSGQIFNTNGPLVDSVIRCPVMHRTMATAAAWTITGGSTGGAG